jgi:hypothetical protein
MKHNLSMVKQQFHTLPNSQTGKLAEGITMTCHISLTVDSTDNKNELHIHLQTGYDEMSNLMVGP